MITALRARDLAAVRAAITHDPDTARHARSIGEAARLAYLPGIRLLHRAGADLNAVYRNYRPLHSLIQEDPHHGGGNVTDRLAALDWMLAHGADVEQLGGWPSARAIIVACGAGQPEYVERVRKAGAVIDGFATAALGDRARLKKLLAGNAALVAARDHGILTALHCAALSRTPGNGTLECARLLLDAGADIAVKAKSWQHEVGTLYLAANAQNYAVFALLLERGADPHGALSCALWNGGIRYAELAIEYGADPDRATADRQPLLNNLIRWGRFEQAYWLLARGASPNLPDGKGWTAVHQAVSRGNERMLRALLEAGGDPQRRDAQGYTAVQLARLAMRPKIIAVLDASAG